MLEKLEFESTQIVNSKKKGVLWELQLGSHIGNLPTHLIVKLTRPVVDEKAIERSVTYRYQDKLKDSLFSEEIKKQMAEEVTKEIEQAKEKRRKMCIPTILEASVAEYKDNGDAKIIVRINKKTGLFLFQNFNRLDTLLITIEQYPPYITAEKDMEDIIKKFKEENEDAVLNIETVQEIGKEETA